jgi:hypothetical protein
MNEKPKPIKPDLVNGHSDWNTDDWLESIDPGGWVDDKRSELDSNYKLYLDLLNKGLLDPNTSYELFEKLQNDFDTDIISKIKKRIQDKNRIEGIASLFSLRSPDRI